MTTLLTLAAAAFSSATFAAGADATLRAELERIAQRRILFGHQSVGENLLDGIRQLSLTAGVPLRVIETAAADGVAPATFGHTRVSRNGDDPLLKLESFENAFGQQPSGIDIALVKFCYVDIKGNTDANSLFARYRSSIDRLRANNPGTVFVHVTVPLTQVSDGLKVRAQRLFGRAPEEAIENLRREEYNALLRRTYGGREPVFDLARIESTTPDGAVATVEWNGSVVPVMVPAYTDDGGHLNSVGRLRAARELVSVLAAVSNGAPDARPGAGR